MSSSKRVPPLASSGVFYVSACVDIDAPIDKVWQILLDFGSYKEWNPFVRGQTIVDRSKQRLTNQTPVEGQYLFISPVHIPPALTDSPGFFQKASAFEIITVLDHENYRCAWENIEMPRWLMNAERWQWLTVVDGKTRYESQEVFGGLVAYIIKYILRGKLQEGFSAMGLALKKRAET